VVEEILRDRNINCKQTASLFTVAFWGPNIIFVKYYRMRDIMKLIDRETQTWYNNITLNEVKYPGVGETIV
jgi:hypothetical protein